MEHTSTNSFHELTRRDVGILAAAGILGVGIYLLASAFTYRVGFPLDDSWIHLTYARNLALRGEWAFQPGQLSAGSTAPLWTFLLAIGFWLRLGPYAWTYFLGEVALIGLAALAEYGARHLVATYRPSLPWTGLFFVAEWHLQWAAVSGMETILQGLLLTSVLVLLILGTRRYLLLGVLTGLGMWVRPDAVTLLGPVLLAIALAPMTLVGRLSSVWRFLLGFGALFVLYLAFNLWLSGSPMPNTFYAKQAEYAAWQARPLLYRFSVLLVQLLTGPGLFLLPGFVGSLVVAIRRRSWGMLAVMAWCAGYMLLYILRLPAYQHGRYLMPAMPAYFLLGLCGYLEFRHSGLFGRWQAAAQQVWGLSLALLTLGFVVLGSRSYAQDVGLIESEMVVTAKWVQANIPSQALVAAHDIGALGYFDDHRLIDLAGLVSPEVIPFIRDEARLADFLDRQHAGYLVAFPAFYPKLAGLSKPIFTSGGSFAPAIGEKNMAVYVWHTR